MVTEEGWRPLLMLEQYQVFHTGFLFGRGRGGKTTYASLKYSHGIEVGLTFYAVHSDGLQSVE